MNLNYSKILFLATAILLTIAGCKEDSHHDKSLTLKEYRKIGMPDPGRNWQSHDFALAFSVLKNLKISQPYNLPIKDSHKSGEIFHRILSLDNMQFINDESTSSDQKVHLSKSYLRVCENSIRLYTMQDLGRQYYHRELTDAYLFGLVVTDIMLDLDNQASPIKKFDNTNPVQSIYLSGLFNLLSVQNQASQFTEKDHHLLIKEVSQSIEKNEYWFDDITREDLRIAFQLISDSTDLKNFDANYDQLIGVL